MIEQFHQPNNAEMHQKSLVQSIIHLSPVLTEVLEQGIEEGIFYTHTHKKQLNYYSLQHKSYLMMVYFSGNRKK